MHEGPLLLSRVSVLVSVGTVLSSSFTPLQFIYHVRRQITIILDKMYFMEISSFPAKRVATIISQN